MPTESLDRIVSAVLAPARFVSGSQHHWAVRHDPPAEMVWEIYLGHLLGPGRTRETRRLETWRLVDEASPDKAPLVRVHWDVVESQLFVVRDVLVHGWVSRESAPGVISSEQAEVWQGELVGTLDWNRPTNLDASRSENFEQTSGSDRGHEEARAAAVERELATLVEMALVGTSRLPITSVESPAMAFAWGEAAYLPDECGSAARANESTWSEALRRAEFVGSDARAARALEFALRSATLSDVPQLAERLARDVPATELARWWRTMFQQVSLAPHTDFLERVVAVLRALAEPDRCGIEFCADLVSYMLRHLVRHLTAYDLITFHSFGANYPDALWLDSLLQTYLEWIERQPESFIAASDELEDSKSETGDEPASNAARARRARRLRRRALRQAWLVRLRYEGLRVPDRPTSQGERLRVSRAGEPTVPEEQLLDPSRRHKRLFEADPLAARCRGAVAQALEAAWRDLADPRELLELGTATFVDRPLGIFKEAGEVDRTPFLSYEACSARRAGERLTLALSAGLLGADAHQAALERVAALFSSEVRGVRATDLPGEPRAGVIMLEDARQAADDFVIRRTTRGSFLAWADMPAGLSESQREQLRRWARGAEQFLLIRTAGPADAARGRPLLTLYDEQLVRRATVRVIPPGADDPVYREAFGVEYLAGGLRLDLASPE